jgi:hypothetical protein
MRKLPSENSRLLVRNDAKGIVMTIERYIRLVAGAFVFASVALGYWLSPYFYAFSAFVGLNLFQSAFTQWCPLTHLLKAAGVSER